MKYTNAYLLELLKEHGSDKMLELIDIANVEDHFIRINLQCLHNARIELLKQLQSRVANKKQRDK